MNFFPKTLYFHAAISVLTIVQQFVYDWCFYLLCFLVELLTGQAQVLGRPRFSVGGVIKRGTRRCAAANRDSVFIQVVQFFISYLYRLSPIFFTNMLLFLSGNDVEDVAPCSLTCDTEAVTSTAFPPPPSTSQLTLDNFFLWSGACLGVLLRGPRLSVGALGTHGSFPLHTISYGPANKSNSDSSCNILQINWV